MTAICYSQFSAFRSPWVWGGGVGDELVGGVDKRLADLLGLLLPPPPPSSHNIELPWAACFSPLSPSPPLFIPLLSPQSFSRYIHPSVLFPHLDHYF